MIQPVKYLGDRTHLPSRRQCGPLDHNNRYAQFARRVQLGDSGATTRVFCDNFLNPEFAHQRGVASEGERTARHDNGMVGQWQRCRWWIDQSKQIVMLWLIGKAGEVQSTNGQHDTTRGPVQRFHGTRDISCAAPIITWLRLPGWARQGEQWNFGLSARGHGMMAHLGGKWMCCINNKRDVIISKEGFEAGSPAKSTDAMWDWLRSWIGDAARVRQSCADLGVSQGLGKGTGFGRPTQDQEVVVHGR
jgi:hypothetical protein